MKGAHKWHAKLPLTRCPHGMQISGDTLCIVKSGKCINIVFCSFN